MSRLHFRSLTSFSEDDSYEFYVGGKASTAHKSKPVPKKHAVIALVERGGRGAR